MPRVTRFEYSQSDPEDGQPKSYATLELAKACPKCKKPGMEKSTTPVRPEPGSRIQPGTVAKIFSCMNEGCRWFRTTWVVQVNPDGTVPAPHRKEKQFNVDPVLQARARQLAEATERQLEREQGEGGAEIRGYF